MVPGSTSVTQLQVKRDQNDVVAQRGIVCLAHADPAGIDEFDAVVEEIIDRAGSHPPPRPVYAIGPLPITVVDLQVRISTGDLVLGWAAYRG